MFVSRLQKYCNEGQHNLGLQDNIQVFFYGIPGGSFLPGPKCIENATSSAIFHEIPDAIFLEIGSSDLCSSSCTPRDLAFCIVSFASKLTHDFKTPHVIIGQILPRFKNL